MIGGPEQFCGIPLVETANAIERVEDWSGCRSQARARRRAARGFKQRMVVRARPVAWLINGVLFIHPELAMRLRAAADSRAAPPAPRPVEKRVAFSTPVLSPAIFNLDAVS